MANARPKNVLVLFIVTERERERQMYFENEKNLCQKNKKTKCNAYSKVQQKLKKFSIKIMIYSLGELHRNHTAVKCVMCLIERDMFIVPNKYLNGKSTNLFELRSDFLVLYPRTSKELQKNFISIGSSQKFYRWIPFRFKQTNRLSPHIANNKSASARMPGKH